jgi:diguanylate cyclase (GGDEF)-like protein
MFYFFARQFLTWNLSILEDDLALRDTRVVERTLAAKENLLVQLVGYHSTCLTTYQYVKDNDTDRLILNFPPSFAKRFSLNNIFVFDNEGELIYQHGDWTEFINAKTTSSRLLIPRLRFTKSLAGLVETDTAVHLFATHTIKPVYEDEAAGTLLLTMNLHALLESAVSEQTSRKLKFYRIADTPSTASLSVDSNQTVQHIIKSFEARPTTHLVNHRTSEKTSAFFPLKDYRGKLIGVAEVIFPHESLYAAHKDIEKVLALMMFAGIIFALALAALLVRLVVNPLLQLRRQVVDIRKTRNLSKRVAIASRDEIGQLANAFNHLLEALQSAEKELIRKNRELFHLSTTDELTGLQNRRFMSQNLDKEVARAKRFEHDVSCMILDIDFFKDVNDSYGHATGDQVLAEVSALLRADTREVDSIARWGGEEFLVLLPVAREDEAYQVAERIRKDIGSHQFVSSKSLSINLTVSIGVVSLVSSGAKNVPEFIRFADDALYKAKSSGRNCTVVYKSASYEQSRNNAS